MTIELRAPVATPRVVRLGSLVAAVVAALGVRPCARCLARAARLNGLLAVVLLPWFPPPCKMHKGDNCTGGWRPVARTLRVADHFNGSPGDPLIEQTCTGRFQRPWIRVCKGRPPEKGCEFCPAL